MINFENAMIMMGSTGIECEHSIYNNRGRAVNNHWLKGSDGNLYTRSAGYALGLEPQIDKVKNGELLKVSLSEISHLTFELADIEEVKKAFN